jgi:hypothetical protein
MDRFYTFESIELVRIGTGSARVTRITRERVNYTNEAGKEQFVDLEECARVFLCLEAAGRFPPLPVDNNDWGQLADTAPGFTQLDVSGPSLTIGLRGSIDHPPWLQFFNRRRTQFEFKNYEEIREFLRTVAVAGGWQTFDGC